MLRTNVARSRGELSSRREATMARAVTGARMSVNQQLPTNQAQDKAQINPWHSNVEKSEPVNGLGSVLLKTRDAMGRLLG
jgi:hypothetical protein